MPITPSKKRILHFIETYSEKKDYPPTIPEIAHQFELAISTVHQHLSELEDEGYLLREKHKARGIEIPKIQTSPNIEDSVPVKNDVSKPQIKKYKKVPINKIIHGDAIAEMKKIPDKSVDLIFADPPYNLSKSNYEIKFTKTGGKNLTTNKGSWDRMPPEDFESFTDNWLREAFRILKDKGAFWVAGTYHNIYLTGYLMEKIGFEILNEVLWHKTDATPNLSCTRFVADHENFLWARKEKGNLFNYKTMKKLNGGKQMRSIWPRGKTAGGKRVHPTQKPEWLLERIILATTKKHDIVFDPFLGSGTTAVVAKKLGRRYLGTEVDKNFYNLAKKRIENL